MAFSGYSLGTASSHACNFGGLAVNVVASLPKLETVGLVVLKERPRHGKRLDVAIGMKVFHCEDLRIHPKKVASIYEHGSSRVFGKRERRSAYSDVNILSGSIAVASAMMFA